MTIQSLFDALHCLTACIEFVSAYHILPAKSIEDFAAFHREMTAYLAT